MKYIESYEFIVVLGICLVLGCNHVSPVISTEDVLADIAEIAMCEKEGECLIADDSRPIVYKVLKRFPPPDAFDAFRRDGDEFAARCKKRRGEESGECYHRYYPVWLFLDANGKVIFGSETIFDTQMRPSLFLYRNITEQEGDRFVSTGGSCRMCDSTLDEFYDRAIATARGNRAAIEERKRRDREFFVGPDSKRVVIPGNVQSVGIFSFKGCKDIEELCMPSELNAAFLFHDSVKKISSLTVSAGSRIICAGMCIGMENLSKVELPNGIIAVEDGAFSGCRSLKRIDLPSSVKRIGEWAFSNCEGLEKIELPVGIIEMGECCFADCIGLKELRFGGNAPSGPESILEFTREDLLIVVPDGSTGWGEDAEGKLPPTWQGKKIVRKSEYEKMTEASTAK